MDIRKQFKDGLLTQNPVLVQLLGMCSTMAITTTLFNGLGMGLSVTLILICSNVVISLLRKVIPEDPYCGLRGDHRRLRHHRGSADAGLSPRPRPRRLGMFIPLIVVNCIILGRAEAFASKNSVPASVRTV